MADNPGVSSGDTIILDDKPMRQDPPVPGYVQQINKLSNTVVSSATIALIRALALRPSASAEPPANIPPWYAEQYKARASWQAFLRQYGRDTIALTGAAYLMDAVEYAMKSIRGTDKDPGNKMMGGVAAGGLLGVMWYPANSSGRAVMTATGALVGYLAFSLERSTRVLLLDQQRRLEKELLHKADAEVRSELDPPYLRQLLAMKQRQLVTEHQQEHDRIKRGYEQWKEQARAGGPAGMPPQRPAREVAAEERRGWGAAGGMAGEGSGGSGGYPGDSAAGVFGARPAADVFAGVGGGRDDRRSGDQQGVLRIGEDDIQSTASDGGIFGGGGSAGGGARGGLEAHGTRKWDVQEQRRGDSDWLIIKDDQDSR